MAGRHYTDKEKAMVLIELETNDGNIKRTARNMGIPAPTVRRWRDEWDKAGVPEEVSVELEPIMSDFLDDAYRIRHKLLMRLEELVDDKAIGGNHVATAIGIISDKIRAYEATKESRKVEHTISLPPAEDLKELMQGLLGGIVDSARQRAADIEATQIEESVTTEYRELLPAKE
jgi:hypothetical protein